MPRLVSIGECMVEMRPAGGEGLFRMGFAGDSFNTAWYLRRLLGPDWAVDYLSAVGTDPVSERMTAFMAGAGIGTAHVARLAGATVGLYLIELTQGERRFAYWRGQSAARRLAEDPARLADALHLARWIYLSGITMAILPPDDRAALLQAVARARADGAQVAFDTNLRPALWPGGPDEAREWLTRAARGADLVLPSFDEDGPTFGDADPAATAARYRALGARTVVVKSGPGEIVAVDAGEGEVRLRPVPVDPVDSTAAGDSFNAAFLAARIGGADLAAAIAAGAALAARVVGAHGALVGTNGAAEAGDAADLARR
jgi:2-dehydro-3-deoxygluconokinase